MKNMPVTTQPPAADAQADLRTRDRVARTILQEGPSTTAALAAALGLTPTAVRRHLDALVATGQVAGRAPATRGPRGRGRPARVFSLTDAGHAAMTTAYDDLAASALRYLATVGGSAAVEGFAAERVRDLEQRYEPVVASAGPDVTDRVSALAGALAADGFAASTRPSAAGTQLCQGHCPVQHVAAEFPQLCDAEAAVFARLVGAPVQRLSTLARGDHVCTTHISTSTTHSTAPQSNTMPSGRTPS